MKVPKMCLFLPIIALAGYARAAAITVNNHSFEADVLGAGGWSDNAPTGWSDPEGNSGTNFLEHITGFASDGNQHVGFASGLGMLYQDLSAAWAPNTVYTLVFGVGNRAGFGAGIVRVGLWSTDAPAPAGTQVALNLPDVYAEDVITNGLAAQGAFADATVAFSTGAVAPSGNIRLSFQATGGGARIHLDNIRFSSTPIPEPVTPFMTLLASLVLGLHRSRR